MQKVTQELKKMRKKVESIDIQIIRLLNERFIFTNQIQNLKRALILPILQKKREKTLLNKYKSIAKKYHLPEKLITHLFRSIFSYAKKTGIIKRTNGSNARKT